MKYRSIDPRTLRAGDFFDKKGGDYYIVHYVSEVREGGLWIECLYRDTAVYTYDSDNKRVLDPNYRFYHLLAGHGGLIPWTDPFWNRDEYVKLGYVPSLVGKRSVYVGSPMCSHCQEKPPFRKSKRGLCITHYVQIEKPELNDY